MEKSILELETRLGLNEGFFEGLKSEDIEQVRIQSAISGLALTPFL
jgi:hypothetical protein